MLLAWRPHSENHFDIAVVSIRSPTVSCEAKESPPALASLGKWNEEKINLRVLLEGGSHSRGSTLRS